MDLKVCGCVLGVVMWSHDLPHILEVTVVVRKTDVKAISSVLEGLQGSSTGGSGRESIRFIICEAPDGEDVGSADALRILKGRVKVILIFFIIYIYIFITCTCTCMNDYMYM